MKVSTILDHIDSGHTGFRCFTNLEEFRRYIELEILAQEPGE